MKEVNILERYSDVYIICTPIIPVLFNFKQYHMARIQLISHNYECVNINIFVAYPLSECNETILTF